MSKPRISKSLFTPEQASAIETLLKGPKLLKVVAVEVGRTIWNTRDTLDTCEEKGYVTCTLLDGIKSDGSKGRLREYHLLEAGKTKYKEYMSLPESDRGKTRSNKRMEAKLKEIEDSKPRETGSGWTYRAPSNYLEGASVDV